MSSRIGSDGPFSDGEIIFEYIEDRTGDIDRVEQRVTLPDVECERCTLQVIQFTYGPASPVAKEVLAARDLNARRGNFAWWNMPPATVYVYAQGGRD